jgi:type I restriction enzyme S subunit
MANKSTHKLPKGWQVKTLGEVCTIQLGKTPYRKTDKFWDQKKQTNNVWLSIADLKHGEIINDSKEYVSDLGSENIKITPKNTLMLSFKLTIGRVSFAGIDLFTNEAIASLIDLNKQIDKKFLFYYFSFFDWDKLTQSDIKIKGKTLNKEKLKKISIPIPPLAEQQQIVATLDSLFAYTKQSKEDIQQNIQNTKDLFNSKLEQIFNNKDNNWQEKKLDDVCIIKGGKRLPKGEKLQDKRTKFPYIRIADFDRQGGVNLTGVKYLLPSIYEQIKNYTISKNDVFLSIAGTIGITGVIPKQLDGANLTENACKLTFNNNILDKYFLYFYTNSIGFKQQVKLFTKTTAQPKLALSRIKNIVIKIPPLEQQQTIVNNLDKLSNQVQQLGENYQNQLKLVEELEQSILQKTFSGKFFN